MRLLRSIEFLSLVALLLLAAVYWWHYAPQLPERLPTHFDPQGRADRWTGREGFAWYYWGILGGVVAVFLGAAVLMLRLPASALSLPHRERWLASDRAPRTRLDLARRFLTLANATVVFDLVLTHLAVKASFSGEATLGGEFNWILGIYLAYVALWTGLLLWRYSRGPTAA